MVDILIGIGNPLRGDDGAGNYVASRFRKEGWQVLDCGTAPENFSGVVRRERPEILILVDAADMGLSPGDFRIIPADKIRDAGLGTHQLPLDIFIGFLGDCAGKILLVGIQPGEVATGEGLTQAVREGADRLLAILESGDFSKIGVFE